MGSGSSGAKKENRNRHQHEGENGASRGRHFEDRNRQGVRLKIHCNKIRGNKICNDQTSCIENWAEGCV